MPSQRVISADRLTRMTTSTFLFEVEGIEVGSFLEVSGLEVSIETEDVQEGGQNGFVHKLPGRMTWPNITLKRGITQQNALMDWLYSCSGEQFAGAGNKIERKTASLTLVEPQGDRLRAWNFVDAFPVKWTGPTISVTSAEVPTEQLEITHHGFVVDRP